MGDGMVAANIDEYIANASPDASAMLEEMRKIIRSAAPDATETISWQMPTFCLEGILVQFAAFARHIGFYPGPSAIREFNDEISRYKWAKGSVQFPIGEPLPPDLITRIVKYRIEENLREAAEKKAEKAARRALLKKKLL